MAKGINPLVILVGLLFITGCFCDEFFDTGNYFAPNFDDWRNNFATQHQSPNYLEPQTPILLSRRNDNISPSTPKFTSFLEFWPSHITTTNGLNNFNKNLKPNLNPTFRENSSSDENDSSSPDVGVLSTAVNNGNGDSVIATAGGSVAEGNRNPFEVDVITSDVPNRPESNFFLHHSIPFFDTHPLFSTFGNFAGFGSNRREPWWKGPNVCTERIENEEDEDVEKKGNQEKEKEKEPSRDVEQIESDQSTSSVAQFFSGFQFSLNSCVEKPHKHVCKQVYNRNGKKKTLTITRQCCHGYGRLNADINTECEKLNLKPVTETAEELDAKEFVKSAKNNDLEQKLLSNITLFLPTDVAFTEFSEQMFENNLVVLPLSRTRRQAGAPTAKGYSTKDLSLNHIVDGMINMDDVRNEDLLHTNYENSTIRINVFPRPYGERQPGESAFRYTANCAPIIKPNKFTTNGVIHVLDRVLTPVKLNVMDIIKEREDMTVLRAILEKTKMNELLEGDKPLTILAPTDQAFKKLDKNLRRTLKEGKGCAINILKNHILDLTFCSIAVVADAKTTAYNLLGDVMRFERSNVSRDDNSGNEIADLTGLQEIIVNGEAKVTESDIMATNGVVHVLDTIMSTESALPITSLMDKKNLTIFKSLIEAAELQDIFDDFGNVTYFIPTDKAFDGSDWKYKLEEKPEELKNNDELKELLQYHIAEPMTKTCDLSEKMVSSKTGQELRINLYSTHPIFTNIMNRATVNCARLMHFDDESCGSVLHQVDKVLTPPKMTLLETLDSNPDYAKFVQLLKTVNIQDLLDNKTESYTVLVPKNDVFEESTEWLEKLVKNPTELEDLLKTHIINDVICCAGIIPTNWPFVRTIETINQGTLKINRDRRPKIENAGVTKCDIIASNGIIHEINDVIAPRKRQQYQNRPLPNFESVGDLLL